MRSFFTFLSRNKLYTLIEFAGMAFSLGFLILLFNYAKGEYSKASSQPLSKEVYVAGMDDFIGMTYGTPDYLSPKVPEITEWCRYISNLYTDCKIGDEWRMIDVAAVDPNFFDFFDFEFEGTTKDRAWESLSSAVLSRSFASALFPDGESPVGKSLSIEVGDGVEEVMITGVIEDFTDTFLQPADMILNAGTKLCSSFFAPMDNFGVVAPFFKVAPGTDIEALNAKLDAAYKEYWDYWGEGFIGPSRIYRMDEIYFSDTASGNFYSGDKGMVQILLAVCLVLLVSAILNYINMTSAQASKRAKEMATRRLLGASKGAVVRRYIFESLVFTTVSFVAGLLLAAAFRVPVERAIPSDAPIRIGLFPDAWTALAYLAIILVVGVVSGLIPAVFVSRFKPIDIVRGEFLKKSKMVFSRVFISLQALLAIVLCAVSFSMFAQLRYLSSRPLGYNTDNLIQIGVADVLNHADGLAQEVEKLPMVKRTGWAGGAPYRVGAQIMETRNGEEIAVRYLQVDSTAFDMFGFKIEEHYTKSDGAVYYYTRNAADILGISRENPIPDTPSQNVFTASGILEDFHTGMRTAFEEPVVVCLRNVEGWYYKSSLFVETIGDHAEALKAVRETAKDYCARVTGKLREETLEMQYCDDILDESLSSTRGTIRLTLVFMILAVAISALGMFAMSLYFCSGQSKSIAVRKVYGADVSTVRAGLLRQFVLMAGVAAVLSIPLCVILIRRFLSEFGYSIAFPYWAIALAIAVVMAVTIVSTYFCANNAARRNPVDSLKIE